MTFLAWRCVTRRFTFSFLASFPLAQRLSFPRVFLPAHFQAFRRFFITTRSAVTCGTSFRPFSLVIPPFIIIIIYWILFKCHIENRYFTRRCFVPLYIFAPVVISTYQLHNLFPYHFYCSFMLHERPNNACMLRSIEIVCFNET